MNDARGPSFGVMLNPQFPPGEPVGPHIKGLLDVVDAARDLGFSSLFTLHHYLSRQPTLQPFSLLSRLIDRSGNMTLATGILVLPLLPPVHVAEEAASIDQLSGGRLVLGVGAGYRANEFDSLGVSLNGRARRLSESIGLIRELWRGDTVWHEGEFFSVSGERCSLQPVQAGGPPIWMGATSRFGVRLAGRLGCPWLVAPVVSLRWIRDRLPLYRKAFMGEAEGEGPIAVMRELSMADTRSAAMGRSDGSLRMEYDAHAGHGVDYVRDRYEEMRDDAFLLGGAQDVLPHLQALVDEGVRDLIFRVSWPGSNVAHAIDTLERFAVDVRPELV